jgi:hypothetical protein
LCLGNWVAGRIEWLVWLKVRSFDLKLSRLESLRPNSSQSPDL